MEDALPSEKQPEHDGPAHGAEPLLHVIIDLHPQGRARMQRDMELIRRIVLAVQAKQDLIPRRVQIEGVEDWVLARHVELLTLGGMLDTSEPFYPMDGGPPAIFVKDLSNAGHDLAASLANDTVWGQIKQKISPGDLALLPLKVIKDLGVAMLQAWVLKKAGLEP